MQRSTKIVATMGPAVASAEAVEQLVQAGMNVARLNCSHGDWDDKREFIRWIREMYTGMSPIAILADLQGPKFRIGVLPDGSVEFSLGQELSMGHGAGALLPMANDAVFAAMEPGDRILFGDGDVEVKLLDCNHGVFEAVALTSGRVKSRQGVTLVGKSFDVPCLTDKDLADIEQACTYGVDMIALSYVRGASDMEQLREVVGRYDSTVRLVAKVETKEAVAAIDDVIEASDVIMVARGDLGLQMEIEDVPLAQKEIIHRCNLAGKPVITATQMLESMVTNARPTRAEASDIANAILDGTDAVMLSGETASGAHPIASVRTMARVALKTERTIDTRRRVAELADSMVHDPTEAIARAAVAIAESHKVRALLTTSATGTTPRLVSKYRPSMPVLCASWDQRTQAAMAVVWGVEAVAMPPTTNTDEAIRFLTEVFKQRGMLEPGDNVVVTAGVPIGSAGKTNMVLLHRVE